MTPNKQTVQKYLHSNDKDAFDKGIENDAFVGSPTICVTRMTEEDEVVVAEELSA